MKTPHEKALVFASPVSVTNIVWYISDGVMHYLDTESKLTESFTR